MGTKASKPKKEDPATIASSPGEMAKKQQELVNRRKGGFYNQFKNIKPTAPVGGGTQQLG